MVSNSGASCVLTADAIASGGASALHLAVLQPDTVRGIATVLPGFATATNPVDLTSALLGNSALFSHVLPLLGRDPSVDALIVAVPVAGAGYDVDALAADAGRFAESGTPTIVVSAHAPVAEVFRSHGLPVFATESEAVAALDQWMAGHGRSAAAAIRPRAVVVPEPPAATEVLDEAASLDLLAAGGVLTVPRRLCRDADAVARALLSFGAPVVAKGCTSRVTHKSDQGLVVLGLRTEDEVRRAYSAIDARLRIADPDAAGILVAPMVGGGRELMIGARVDPVFGAVVLVGDGGGHVEVLPDLQVLLPPFDEGDVLAALRRLRIAPLLAGIRGQVPVRCGRVRHGRGRGGSSRRRRQIGRGRARHQPGHRRPARRGVRRGRRRDQEGANLSARARPSAGPGARRHRAEGHRPGDDEVAAGVEHAA